MAVLVLMVATPVLLPRASAASTPYAPPVPRPFSRATTTPRTPTSNTEVTIEVDALSPEVLSSDQDLTVTGTVTNATEETLSTSSLVIDVQRSTEISPHSLNTWLADERDSAVTTAAAETFDRDIAPGETQTFSVTVPAANLPLSDDAAWGPRGVQVTLADGAAALAQDRTIVLWDAGATVEPAQMTVVVPVTASPAELLALWSQTTSVTRAPSDATPTESTDADATAESTDADATVEALSERVLGLLGLAGSGVVLAVDPALMEALGVPDPTTTSDQEPTATATPTPATTSDQTTGTDADLTQALSQAVASGDVVALPWADADVSALTHLKETDLLDSALTRTAESGTAAAGAALDLAWLAGPVDTSTLDVLPESVTTVVASPGDLPLSEALTYTPSGHTIVGDRTVLLPDEVLSGALGGQLVVGDDTTTLSDLDAVQLLRAQTAILARQAPSVSRDVVVTLPRSQAAQTSPEVLRTRITAVTQNSWTQPQDLAGLSASAAEYHETADVERDEPPETVGEDERKDEVTAADLASARETSTYLDSVASILSNPQAALGTTSDIVVHTASATWRTDPSGRSYLVAAAHQLGQSVSDGLAAAPSSTVNLISATADLPVRIVSSLNQDATVRVRLVPSSTRLQAPQEVEVTVPARGQVTASMPVEAVGSGDVDVAIELLAEDGTVVGVPVSVHMRVRADWESIGTRVAGVVLSVLLVTGIVRTVRRGRRNPNPLEGS